MLSTERPEGGFHAGAVDPRERTLQLRFDNGRAPLPPDELEAIGRAPLLRLEVDEQLQDVPRSQGSNPFRCGAATHRLGQLDPCVDPLPQQDPPGDCDERGARRWSQRFEQQEEHAQTCFPAVDRPTLQRLGQAPQLRQGHCPRLVASVQGQELGDLLPALTRVCGLWMPAEQRDRGNLEVAREDLPSALQTARQGTSEQMQSFYLRYRQLAPREAEAIRLLAQERFGPKHLPRWLAIRDKIEAYRPKIHRYTLCEIYPTYVLLGWANYTRPLRSKQAPRETESDGGVPQPRARGPSAEQQQHLERLIRGTTGHTLVRFAYQCTGSRHWYFEPG
jgi:hypothetical protein